MFGFRVGVPGGIQPRSLAIFGVGLLCCLAAGCSSSKPASSPAVYSWNMSGVGPTYRPPAPRRELEDDGLEVQAAPGKHLRKMPDDPSQPWSRNYGRRSTATAVSSWSEEPASRDVHTVSAE